MNAANPLPHALDTRKFRDPAVTAKGEERASVALNGLRTLWFNTGTLCNLTCANCYIESSPTNDRLAYLTAAEVTAFLDEIVRDGHPTEEIGFTGGEPFMNPGLIAMLDEALGRGFRTLVLTNAMRPMMKCADALLDLRARFGDRLALRVSLDHYTQSRHDEERGPRGWESTLSGLKWLSDSGINLAIVGRTLWGDSEASLRAGYARLFASEGIAVDASDPAALVLFPEMNERLDVAEITTACWDLLGVDPNAMMCATSRMVIKRKDAARPAIVPCTLLPYDAQFDMGDTLAAANASVRLNHPHCARFCVLGGGSCSV